MKDGNHLIRGHLDTERKSIFSGSTSTETIDLNSLMGQNVFDSGTFEFSREIWATAFGKVVQALPIPVLFLDRFHNVTSANKAWMKITAEYEVLIGKPFSYLFSDPADAAHSTVLVTDVFSTKKTAHWQALLQINLKRLWARLTFRAIRMMGQSLLLVLVEDLSAEKALSASEERYRRMFEESRAVKLIIDPETSAILNANRAAAEFYGYSADELRQMKIADINVSSPEHVISYKEKSGSGPFTKVPVRHRLRSGDLRDVEVHSSYLDMCDKRVLYSIIHDVTDRKKAETALMEAEEKYRSLFESNKDAIIVFDAQTLRIIDVNNAAIGLYGYSRGEFMALKAPDVSCKPDEFGSFGQGYPVSASESVRYHRKKDGSPFPVEISRSAFSMKKRRCLCEIVRDITDRLHAEKVLKEAAQRKSEERFRAIIDSSPVGIRIVQNGKYVYVNPSFVRMFGRNTKDDIIGTPVEDLYAAECRNIILEKHKSGSCADGGPYHYEAVGVTSSAKRFEVEAWATEIEYLGRRSSLEFVIDVSEAKSLRSQLLQAQKMEAIGTLAGGIAHDFNNLLTVILGYSELMLSEKKEGDRERHDLKKIIHSARVAGDMVRQILAFSRKTEIKPRPVNLNKEVKQLSTMFFRLIPKNISIEIQLDPDLPIVNADPVQIEQVLINLAINARDSMAKGGKLMLKTKRVVLDTNYLRSHITDSEGLHAVLIVSDTGTGMDEATKCRIFEPFYTTKPPGQGTGLGLATVYGIVKSHGGHITCESKPGKGTLFSVYLPANQSVGEAEVKVHNDFAKSASGTIMLVDDEDLVRELGRRILKKAGYGVIEARNGREAVDIYKEKMSEIDLIILDLIMPVMDGNQCLGEILNLNPTADVLIASGYSPDPQSGDMTESGAKGFVGKPYNIGQLLNMVRETITNTNAP